MIRAAFEIIAGWTRLEPLLVAYQRGSDIPIEWIEKESGVAFQRMRGRLNSYYQQRGVKVLKRGPLIHICTNDEQVGAGGTHCDRGFRQYRKARNIVRTVERDKLSDMRCREADHIQRHAAAQVEAAQNYRREFRILTGVPEPTRPILPFKGSE